MEEIQQLQLRQYQGISCTYEHAFLVLAEPLGEIELFIDICFSVQPESNVFIDATEDTVVVRTAAGRLDDYRMGLTGRSDNDFLVHGVRLDYPPQSAP